MKNAKDNEYLNIVKDPGDSIVLTVAKGATDLDGQIIGVSEIGLNEDDSSVYILRKLNERVELYGKANNIEDLLKRPKGSAIVLRRVSNRNVKMKFDELKDKIELAKAAAVADLAYNATDKQKEEASNEAYATFSHDEIFGT